MIRLRTRGTTALLGTAWLLAAACSRPVDGGSPEPRRIRAADLDKVRLGHSTPADVERLFGTPDVRAPDGAIVYGSDTAAPTVTFRFENGAVSKICRTRP